LCIGGRPAKCRVGDRQGACRNAAAFDQSPGSISGHHGVVHLSPGASLGSGVSAIEKAERAVRDEPVPAVPNSIPPRSRAALAFAAI